MAPEQAEHLQTLALLASAPVAVAMFLGSYWLFRAKRIFAVIGGFGLGAYHFGKAAAMKKHPEAFGFPPREE